MIVHDWNEGDPPLGIDDITVLLHGLYLLSAPEDECGRRCFHGGVCTLTVGHATDHDAAGFCQWMREDAKAEGVI